jgi:hypothetical protein
MRRLFALLIPALLVGAISSAYAQQVVARTPAGAATIETEQSENGVRLTIAVAGAAPQVFDGMGEALVPMRAGNRSGPVLAFDIDRDGIDEIFFRSTSQQRGVVIVFRWDASANQYVAAAFTEDSGAPKTYLFVHLSQPVSVNGNTLEANFDSNDGGRKRLRVFRYRWTGNGFEQETSH